MGGGAEGEVWKSMIDGKMKIVKKLKQDKTSNEMTILQKLRYPSIVDLDFMFFDEFDKNIKFCNWNSNQYQFINPIF